MHRRRLFITLNGVDRAIAMLAIVVSASFLSSCASIPEAANEFGPIPDGPAGEIHELRESHFSVDGTPNSAKMLKFSNGRRTLYFVPMIHQAKPAFYQRVSKLVRDLKSRGADLFYEFVDFETASRSDKLRIRALLGFLPTPSFYAADLRQGWVGQDNDDFLNFPGGRDINADLTPQELADAYEELVGPLEISEENLKTPMSEFVFPTSDLAKIPMIIIDLRNRHLARMLADAPSDAVVLYGAAHGPGTLRALLAHDRDWHRVVRRER